MRRKSTRKPGRVALDTINPLLQIPKRTLELIGAVSILWNNVERLLDTMLMHALGLSEGVWLDVVSRINGYDGKIALVKRAAKDARFEASWIDLIALTTAELETCKRYRDGVIHASFPERADIALSVRRRGSEDEVLMSAQALMILYTHILAAGMEITIIEHAFISSKFLSARLPGSVRQEIEGTIRDCFARLRKDQTARASLPPFPPFPVDTQVLPAKEDGEDSQG